MPAGGKNLTNSIAHSSSKPEASDPADTRDCEDPGKHFDGFRTHPEGLTQTPLPPYEIRFSPQRRNGAIACAAH